MKTILYSVVALVAAYFLFSMLAGLAFPIFIICILYFDLKGLLKRCTRSLHICTR
jgi:hypothetical protein